MFFLISYYLMFINLIMFMIFLKIFLFKLNFFIYWNLFFTYSVNIEYIVFIDYITMIFLMVILMISSMVLIYSLNYMMNEKFILRFLMIIMIFIFSMIFMIISPNLLSVLLGWDGLGLSSYCLIIYYQSFKSMNSGMITILMNRIGDIFLIISAGLIMKYGSWNLMLFKNLNMFINFFLMFIFITKSAQIPFSTWLPLAMAAPTPVSSLVHSSTLVTAGIYLMIRFMNLMNDNFLWILMILSMMTLIMSGTTALFEYDLKKIIAFSTLSQLSLMFLTLSLKLKILCFFHLINHAMFKSLIFLCCGILIHTSLNIQDIRYLNFCNLNEKLIMLILNLSLLTLCGLPFLTGFYSKDLIIEMFLINLNNFIIILMLYLSMMLTMMYTIRLIFYLNFSSNLNNMKVFYTMNNLMNNSIYILMFMTIFFGCGVNWMIFNMIIMISLSKLMKLMIYYILFISIILILMNLSMFKMLKFNILFLFI
uniref:NADH:ubiquinone reductase (H(+)-translocating) n=1 Tax=Sigalphus bicolor TaxID=515846 RepID=A0A0A6ZL58_9HYME|nr:NADH dehydrogenase subunit 5 [Sigalphus bicolor]